MWAAERFHDRDMAWAKPRRGREFGDFARRFAIEGERENTATVMQMPAQQRRQPAHVEAERHGILQSPAEPSRGKRKARGRGYDEHLFDGDRTRERHAGTEPERIAGNEHDDGLSAPSNDLRDRRIERRPPWHLRTARS